jgi:hypothetical protein
MAISSVQDVSRKELKEDAPRHEPEDDQRQPIFNGIIRQISHRRSIFKGMSEFFGSYRGMNFI